MEYATHLRTREGLSAPTLTYAPANLSLWGSAFSLALCEVASQQATSVDCIPQPPCRNFLKATTPDDNKRTVTGVAFRPRHRPTLTQQINQFIYLTVSAFFFFLWNWTHLWIFLKLLVWNNYVHGHQTKCFLFCMWPKCICDPFILHGCRTFLKEGDSSLNSQRSIPWPHPNEPSKYGASSSENTSQILKVLL